MQKKNITDEKLREYLQLVNLKYLIDREGGLETVNSWQEVLSGGEK